MKRSEGAGAQTSHGMPFRLPANVSLFMVSLGLPRRMREGQGGMVVHRVKIVADSRALLHTQEVTNGEGEVSFS